LKIQVKEFYHEANSLDEEERKPVDMQVNEFLMDESVEFVDIKYLPVPQNDETLAMLIYKTSK
jgi:hypothetical protein